MNAELPPTVPTGSRPGAPTPAARGTRFGFVDLLRGFALVVMVETHIVNAYLPLATRETALYFWITFFNGLVAPTFLFAAGFSVMLQADRQSFWRQLRRLGFIALVGYYGHMTHFELSRFLAPQEPRVWLESLQVDILQSIVASLLFVHLLIWVFRDRDRFTWAAGAVAAGVMLLTPVVWAHDFRGRVPLFFALYLNPHGSSLFPLFPWISFLLAGVFTSRLFLRAQRTQSQAKFFAWLCAAGGAAIAAGFFGRRLPWTLPGDVNYFTTSPLYVLLRLGWVALFCAALWRWEKSGRWIPAIVRTAGQESLLVYGVHLWLIYAVLRGRHLGPRLGMVHGWAWSFAASAAIIVLMLGLAKLWNFLKRDYPLAVRWWVASATAFMILRFVLR
jgi:uncharacterized membrane protein